MENFRAELQFSWKVLIHQIRILYKQTNKTFSCKTFKVYKSQESNLCQSSFHPSSSHTTRPLRDYLWILSMLLFGHQNTKRLHFINMNKYANLLLLPPNSLSLLVHTSQPCQCRRIIKMEIYSGIHFPRLRFLIPNIFLLKEKWEKDTIIRSQNFE